MKNWKIETPVIELLKGWTNIEPIDLIPLELKRAFYKYVNGVRRPQIPSSKISKEVYDKIISGANLMGIYAEYGVTVLFKVVNFINKSYNVFNNYPDKLITKQFAKYTKEDWEMLSYCIVQSPILRKCEYKYENMFDMLCNERRFEVINLLSNMVL